MATAFKRGLTGRISARLAADERGVLRDLISGVISLVAPPEAPPADPLAVQLGLEDLDTGAVDLGVAGERDPILDRLFPPGYDDADEALEFRRFTELSLRQQKVTNAELVLATLDEGDKITLTGEQAHAWLVVLNDARLALAVRLDIATADDHEMLSALPLDDPRAGMYRLYEFVTFLQGSLIEALS